MNKIIDETLEFLVYVESFYGKGGIYDMGATGEQIIAATQKYINQVNTDFCGDSFDREKVRDIMIEDFGLFFPHGG